MEFNLNKLWNEYIKENSYASPAEFMEDEMEFNLVQSEVVDTWRWGNHNEDVYEKNGEYYSVSYRDASGDGEIDAYDAMAEFSRVEKKEVTVTKFVKVTA